MIFGIKEKCIILTIQCIVVYCYKYTCVTYDCFCAPGHIWFFCKNTLLEALFLRVAWVKSYLFIYFFWGETYRFGYQYVGCVTLITKLPPLIVFQTNRTGCICTPRWGPRRNGWSQKYCIYPRSRNMATSKEDLMPQELSPQQLEMK